MAIRNTKKLEKKTQLTPTKKINVVKKLLYSGKNGMPGFFGGGKNRGYRMGVINDPYFFVFLGFFWFFLVGWECLFTLFRNEWGEAGMGGGSEEKGGEGKEEGE